MIKTLINRLFPFTFFLLVVLSCGGKQEAAKPICEPDTLASPKGSLSMFRGNQYHTFCGSGKVPRSIKLIWKFETGFIYCLGEDTTEVQEQDSLNTP